MIVRKAKKPELGKVLKLSRNLWPDVKASNMRPGYTFYVAEVDKKFIGFILLSIRRDYVAGSTTFPVGYIEGIYVEKTWRKKNVARQLILAAEDWCRQKGFKELGSDVEPKNKASQRFHLRVGFTKEEIVLPYIKKV
jgi:aminoglycoside 6'-N-acetyltransferase I